MPLCAALERRAPWSRLGATRTSSHPADSPVANRHQRVVVIACTHRILHAATFAELLCLENFHFLLDELLAQETKASLGSSVMKCL